MGSMLLCLTSVQRNAQCLRADNINIFINNNFISNFKNYYYEVLCERSGDLFE